MSELQELISAVRSYIEYEKESGVEGYFSPNGVMAPCCVSLMFVGEALEEEGSGGLLTKIIGAMGMRREDVYIASIAECRLPNEVLACLENLRKQIALIKPKVICALGKFSSRSLLGTEADIGSLRGNVYTYEGITVVPTFHPAHLLDNPNDKKLAWDDMKKIRSLIADTKDKG